MEITKFLKELLDNVDHASDLVEIDETEISLPDDGNKIKIKLKNIMD